MTARERATFFNQLCGMREAYRDLDPLDRAGITPIAEAIAAAEQELEAMAADADGQAPADSATSIQHPV